MTENNPQNELDLLRAELAAMRARVEQLEALQAQPVAPRNQATSRRKLLKNLFASSAVGVAGFAAASVVGTRVALAGVTSNPNSQVGAFAQPSGFTFSGTPPSGFYWGLVGTPASTFDFSSLPNINAGVFGYAVSNVGVYGKSGGTSIPYAGVYAENTSTGPGIYATSASGTGIYSTSNSPSSGTAGVVGVNTSAYGGVGVLGSTTFDGVGVAGTSNDVGVSGIGFRGVVGSSNNGTGVVASSTSGAPLRITPGAQPTSGIRQQGEVYVDTSGNLWIYNGSTWKQVQYV